MIRNTDRPIEMSPELGREVDELLARLDYLKRVRRARIEARQTLAANGHEVDTSELDRLLAQPIKVARENSCDACGRPCARDEMLCETCRGDV